MKKVVLLGDSIRLIGYGKKVPEMLGDNYTVFQSEDNCRFVLVPDVAVFFRVSVSFAEE